MIVTRVALPNKANVLLLEDILPVTLLADLHNDILDQFELGHEDWVVSELEQSSTRYQYKGTHTTYNQLEEYMSSPAMLARLQGEVQSPDLAYSYMKLLVDLPGYGPLKEHVELAGEHVAQIYFTRTSDPYHGTSVHNQQKELLFTLPYRNNFGWFFDVGTTVMHSRLQDVLPGLKRFSLMLWYGYHYRDNK
jgi:hypothetical protein